MSTEYLSSVQILPIFQKFKLNFNCTFSSTNSNCLGGSDILIDVLNDAQVFSVPQLNLWFINESLVNSIDIIIQLNPEKIFIIYGDYNLWNVS